MEKVFRCFGYICLLNIYKEKNRNKEGTKKKEKKSI